MGRRRGRWMALLGLLAGAAGCGDDGERTTDGATAADTTSATVDASSSATGTDGTAGSTSDPTS
ncbi:MAG: hypothetical protein KC636_22815, partial [Myxococcales bacterium]|nr:hypothetical protein [Myxococcales bacterium]